MNRTIKIILAGLLLIFFGCENSKIVDVPLQFEENVVVQGELYADTLFPGIRITKTIPINETFDIDSAQIKDAYVYLKINGVKIVPLHFTKKGIYKPAANFFVRSGEVYELDGEADGKIFYSQTIIPQKPVITNRDYNSSGKFMEATTQANPDEVYGAIWNIDKIDTLSANDFYSIVAVDNNASVITRTTTLPDIYRSSYYDGRRFIQVFSFDKQFKSFFNSKDNNQPVSNYFIQGGGSIAWNVYGDHVIGLFIGIAKSSF